VGLRYNGADLKRQGQCDVRGVNIIGGREGGGWGERGVDREKVDVDHDAPARATRAKAEGRAESAVSLSLFYVALSDLLRGFFYQSFDGTTTASIPSPPLLGRQM
jgi:hypothetical protein